MLWRIAEGPDRAARALYWGYVLARRGGTSHDLKKPAENGHDKWSTALQTARHDRCSWEDVDAEDLKAALAAVTADGAALLLGTTTDGGALSIHVLTDRGTHKLYPAHMNELTEALTLITEIAGSR